MKYCNLSIVFLLQLLAVSLVKSHNCSGAKSYLNSISEAISSCSEDANGYITDLKLYSNCLSVEQINTVVNQEHLKTLCFESVTTSVTSTHQSLKTCNTTNVFPSAISGLSKLETVIFNGYTAFNEGDLRKIPSSVKVLGLGEFEAPQYVVDDISTLTNVQELQLSKTKFKKEVKTENFKKLKKLKKLQISNLNPFFMKDFKSLEELNVEKSTFDQKTITEISKLNYLKKLSFNSCSANGSISMSSFQSLTSLESLTITGQKNAEKLPFNDLCKIPNLKFLDLSQNNLKEIPKPVRKLKHLKKFNFCHNHLKAVPEFVGELVNLEEVNFEYNEITTISNGFGNLKKITSANFNNNRIEVLPESFFKATSLKQIYLEKNKFKKFPKKLYRLSKLRAINLKNNLINDEIPTEYEKMTELSEINVELNVEIKGKTLTNPKLQKCNYGHNNKGNKYSICGSKNEIRCGKSIFKDCYGKHRVAAVTKTKKLIKPLLKSKINKKGKYEDKNSKRKTKGKHDKHDKNNNNNRHENKSKKYYKHKHEHK